MTEKDVKIHKVNMAEIPQGGKAPVLDYCRYLLKQGIDPETKLEVYRTRETPDVTVSSIGWGATRTISEGQTGRPKIVRHVPFPGRAVSRLCVKMDEVGHDSGEG